MTRLASAVAPSTLLRALAKHAARDCDDDAEDSQPELSTGVLLGSQLGGEGEDSAVALLGLLRTESDLAGAKQHLPGGVAAVGHFAVLHRAANDDDATIEECVQRVCSQRQDRGDGLVLVFVKSLETAHLFAVSSAGALRKVELEVVECLHAQDFLRSVNCALVRCAIDVNAPGAAELQSQVQQWKAQLSDVDQVFFRVASGKPVFDMEGVDVTSGASGASKSSLSSLLKLSAGAASSKQSSEFGKAKKNAKKKNAAQAALDAWDDEPAASARNQANNEGNANAGYLKTLEYGEIANIEVLCSLAPPSSGSTADLPAAPLLTIPDAKAPVSKTASGVHLHADVLVLVPVQSTIPQMLRRVREELSEQLVQLERYYNESSSASSSIKAVHAHHFALVGAAFPLTLLSSPSPSTPDTTTELHEAFLQPLSQPLFLADRCSLVKQSELLSASDVLINVHEGIPASGVAQGKQYLVDGFYGYYHYMQQQTNDKGWGCAYRSLQTLASWLHLNHYTSKASLSHKEIQETLVSIGDKPASFVGSREWIGSMEVGYVLDELFGVTFRSLSVPSGPRLVEKAQELKHHFESQGTPVMMGGGSLAFTLLGVDYNESTGDCAFLILDPHYTGSEDLSAIQTKSMALEGYKAVPCGWRKATTLAKSFYNLCLPQRPQP